ncbi:surface anchored protein [Streptococcus pneumoniae]|nr:surface anchored protein [Streptococcus pneumoniae]VOA15232.1 surface anchored protein [Streptococcus pneumoniae]
MKKSYRDDNGEKVFRYSIRKYHFGAASVAVAALMFFANGAVAASETITPTTASDIVKVDSDSNADGDPGTSDEEDSSKVSTRQPLELKSVDELKGQEAPVEENNQVQAAAESETTGVESNSAQPETNPASQEAPQAEGEGKQDQSTHVSNQTSSTSLLQPRTLKNNQSDYDPIPLGDDEDDEDDVRDELFSSENPVTTIQPRSPRSVPPKENSSEVKVEAKQSRFGQVKGKNLIHGDDPVNYIKFKDANNREIQKPDGVEVTWAEKPSTAQEGLNKTGRIKIAYYLTSESGVAVKQEKFVTISTPVYHATLTQNPFKTTYGGEFVNKNQPRDGRRYINYNGTSHFNLRELRVYWENSNIRGEKFSNGTRPWSTNYLGKRLEQLEVRYPGDNGRYDHSRDDNGERYERLNGTFIVKPVKPSIQTSLGKVGKNTLTVNNVNSGTTVVAYDMANPRNPREIGRVSVPKDRDYRIKNGIDLTLNSGEVLRKDQKIATKVIYEITNTDQRTESDSSDTLTVKESLVANGIHVIGGETYTGNIKDRIRYNDNVDPEHRGTLPGNATASWAQNPNYTTLGTRNYTANVTIPGRGSATVDVPVYVYAPASLKASSYNNKQGTLSNGTEAENYIQFRDGNATIDKPNNVTVRWKDGQAPDVSRPGTQQKTIEVVYLGNDGPSSTVIREYQVMFTSYHAQAQKREYTRTIGENFTSTTAKSYVKKADGSPELLQETEYAWKKDETANREYGSETWGKVNDDWLGKKTNKIKVYYPNADGGNNKADNLAEETEEITFITKPAKPRIASNLTGQAGTRSNVVIQNATPGTTLELRDGDTVLGKVEVPKNNSLYSQLTTATITPTADIPASANITVKSIYSPNNQDQRVESDSSDAVASTQITVSAKGTIQTLAGTGHIAGLSNLNKATLSTLLNLSDGSAVADGTTGRWESGQNIAKGQAGTRTEKLFVRLPGHTKEQEVTFTVKTLAVPSAKAVVKDKGQDIVADDLSNYVTVEGQTGLSWKGNPSKVEVGKTLPKIKVTYPRAGQNGIAVTDIQDQEVDAKVYSLEVNGVAKTRVTVGEVFDPVAADYVTQVANTETLPSGVSYAWKNGNKPSSARVGKETYTVETSFGIGNDVPAELRGQKVETQVEVTVLSTKPSQPELGQNRNDLAITAVVGKENANKAVITFRDDADQEQTVTFEKGANNQWDKVGGTNQPTVQILNNNDGTATVHLTAGTAKVGSSVSIKQQKADSDYSEAATLVAKERLDGVSATSKDDGSVDVVVPSEAKKASVTYTPEGQSQAKTVELAKAQDGTWSAPANSGLLVNKDNTTGILTITVPASQVADGSKVVGNADSDSKLSIDAEARAKAPQPVEFDSSIRHNGDIVLTLPNNADRATINYPVSDTELKTATATKGQDGSWRLSPDSGLELASTNGVTKITLAYTKLSGNRIVTASAKAGSGEGESKERTFTKTVPAHTTPTTQNVVIAANATPTDDQLLTGVIANNKQSVAAKQTQTAIAAGTTKEIPATLTYTDGSTEEITITVQSKPTAPTVNGLESRARVAVPGLLSTARTITGQAMQGAEKVKLTLQNGSEKEVDVAADGSWSYTLAADEFLTQTISNSNAKYSSTKIRLVQVKDGLESEPKDIDILMGRATIDTPLRAGRDITLHIPHDTTSGYIRIGGSVERGGVDIGLKKVNGVWTLDTDANRASKLELVSETDPTNPALTKVTLKVKATDDASYSPPFTIGGDSGNVKFRAHYYSGRDIGAVVPMGRQGQFEWILSGQPTNTRPTVGWETGKEIQDGQKIPSPTVDKLKDFFKGEDAEDDAGLTVGYSASNRGKLRVRLYTSGTNQTVRTNVRGRIDPGNYRLLLSTIDAAGVESNILERNVIIQSYADYYRDAVQYPTPAQKVTYSDTDITNGNFTAAAKTRFKDKIETINRQNTQLPTSTTYSVGNTDDKERVAVLGFPDGSTIDISHSQVAKPDVPTITPTDTEQQGMPKVTDADREISGTALQNATKVTLKLQTGKGIEIVKEITVNNTKDFAALVPGEGLLKNGVWKYKLADGQYLRQTDATAEPGSSSLPLKATQTVFDAVSDDTSIYVANKRTVEGKKIEGEVGSPDLKKYIDKPQDAVVYKEKGQEKPFPSDFIAKWENTPNFDTVGTFTYKVKFYEKDGNTPADHISEGVEVTFVVKSKAPAILDYTNRDNGETLVNIPQDADEVVFSILRSDTAVDTITVKKSEGWTATGIQKRDNTWVFPANSVHGNRTVTAVATAGKGDTKSVEMLTLITTLAHDVTVNEITKPTKGNPTSQDLLDAVEVTNKKSVALKQGENYPETFGTHQIHLIVTYQDDSTEEKVANYTVPDTRDAAKDDIDTKATAKKNDIEADDQLTTEEKQAAKDKVDAAAQSAKDAVTAATTNDGVTQAQNDGTTAVNNVDTTPQAKPSAKAEIDAKVQDANNAIDQNQDLTDDERREAKKAVKDAADEAKANIDKATSAGELTTAKNNGLDKLNEPHDASVKQKAKDDIDTKATAKKNDIEADDQLTTEEKQAAKDKVDAAAQSGTNPVTPPSTTRSRRTPPRRSRRSVGFVGNSQTGTTPSAVDKSELQSLVEDLERRLQDLADLSPEALEEAQSILREAQVALANDSLTAQELTELLAKVRQALNSIQAGTSADKSPSTSNSNKEAESAKEPTNATDVPLYGVFGAAVLSLLGALLFAVARKKNSQLDKLSRELDQLLVELEASDKDKKGLGKAKKLAKKARTFVDSQQKDPQKEAELISEIKTILSQLREGV